MTSVFTIRGVLPGLNEATRLNRANRYVGAKSKADAELVVAASILAQRPAHVLGPVTIHFDWYEPSNRRDPDNVRHAAKYILDALTRSHVIENDSRRFVRGLSDSFFTDPANPRIEVTVREAS